MDATESKIVSDVATVGWHMISVPADEHGPGFTYTIGLIKSYSHPEVIIFGLANEVMQRVVAVVATLVKGGRAFVNGDVTDEVLENYVCAFRTVRRAHYEDHLGYAMWFNRTVKREEFQTLQCVWPDRNRRFPWESECEEAIRRLQPALYEERT